MFGLSHWQRTLHCNIVSHWLTPFTEWFLRMCPHCPGPDVCIANRIKLIRVLTGAIQEMTSLQWRHNGRYGVSNHQSHDFLLLNHLFRRRSKKTSKLRFTGLCAGNSPVTGEFPAQMSSNAGNVSIWWRHHVMLRFKTNDTRHWIKPVIGNHEDIRLRIQIWLMGEKKSILHLGMLSFCFVLLLI